MWLDEERHQRLLGNLLRLLDVNLLDVQGLDEERHQRTLGKLLQLLDVTVQRRLAETLSKKQMDQLSDLLSKGDIADADISQWLAQNVPNYRHIVEEEAQKIKKTHEEHLRMMDEV